MRPTYLLRERATAECALTLADVEFLRARHRTHVRVLPTGRPGTYRLTPTGHVGTLLTPDCRLVIRPKVPLKNLLHLLDPLLPPTVLADRGGPEPIREVLDVLASELARRLAERAAAGLHRDYAERAEAGPILRGKLDVAAQVRHAAGRKDLLHCQFNELTADVPCNQVPRATAELLLRCPLVTERVRGALRQALAAFADVRPGQLTEDGFRAAAPNRLTEAYRPLWELCRLLADALAAGGGQGDRACPAFLIDMERVFERYVARQLTAFWGETPAAQGDLTVVVQPWYRGAPEVRGQPDFALHPDVTLTRHGRPVAALDSKWKRLPRARLVTPDVYQVLAYCAVLGLRHAALVYPGRNDRTWTYRPESSAVRLTVHTLRVVGSSVACAQSGRRLARDLARAVGRSLEI